MWQLGLTLNSTIFEGGYISGFSCACLSNRNYSLTSRAAEAAVVSPKLFMDKNKIVCLPPQEKVQICGISGNSVKVQTNVVTELYTIHTKNSY